MTAPAARAGRLALPTARVLAELRWRFCSRSAPLALRMRRPAAAQRMGNRTTRPLSKAQTEPRGPALGCAQRDMLRCLAMPARRLASPGREVRLALGIALLAAGLACTPAPRAPSPRPPPPASPSTSTAATTCVRPELLQQLACSADARVRLAAAPPVTWPSGDHLFHATYEAPWRRPLDPRALATAVGRATRDPADGPRDLELLDAADRAFDAAATPEAQAEPAKGRAEKWRAAADGYADFLGQATSRHRLLGYALHRRTRALWNAGRPDDALTELVALMRHLDDQPAATGTRELRELARADLAPLYAASARKPLEARAFVAVSPANAEETTRRLEELGEAYLAVGRYDDARAILAELTAAHPPARACQYAARGLAVSIVEHADPMRLPMTAMKELLTLAKRAEQSNDAPTEKERCRTATIVVVVELASAWRTEALGWNGVEGSGDLRLLAWVEELFAWLSGSITPAELDATKLESVPAANRPSSTRLALAQAELDRLHGRLRACVAGFERARRLATSTEAHVTAIDGALGCYERMLRDAHWPEVSARPSLELGDALDKVPLLARERLCAIAPSEADPVGVDRALAVELLRGRVLFGRRRWEQASAALARLAYQPGYAQAREAAAMYAIGLQELAMGGNRRCGEDLTRERERLVALHCAGADGDEALAHLSVPGMTTEQVGARLTPCEALRALGAPPAPPTAPPPRPPASRRSLSADRVAVHGAVVPEVIGWGLALHTAQLRACYAAALRQDPFFEPPGRRMSISLTIARSGEATEPRVDVRGDRNEPFVRCVESVLRTMRFTPPEGGEVHVEAGAEVSLERGVRLGRLPTLWQSPR